MEQTTLAIYLLGVIITAIGLLIRRIDLVRQSGWPIEIEVDELVVGGFLLVVWPLVLGACFLWGGVYLLQRSLTAIVFHAVAKHKGE